LAQTLRNDLPDFILKEPLPNLFKAYEKIKPNRPSAWFYWTNEGGVGPVSHDVCHSLMRDENSGWDHLITAIPNSDPRSISFQRMLINGPFRGFSDLIHLGQHNGHYYAHCADLDKWPANVLYNYCIATRAPVEWPTIVEQWDVLCKEGYNQTLAFLLSSSIRGLPFGGIRTYFPDWHFPFDTASNWKNILAGKMVSMSYSFKSDPSCCQPCNVIWGHSDDYKKIVNLSDKEVAEFYGLAIEPPKVIDIIMKPPEVVKKVKKPQAIIPPIGQAGVMPNPFAFVDLPPQQVHNPFPQFNQNMAALMQQQEHAQLQAHIQAIQAAQLNVAVDPQPIEPDWDFEEEPENDW
jgi:hypothetical protein